MTTPAKVKKDPVTRKITNLLLEQVNGPINAKIAAIQATPAWVAGQRWVSDQASINKDGTVTRRDAKGAEVEETTETKSKKMKKVVEKGADGKEVSKEVEVEVVKKTTHVVKDVATDAIKAQVKAEMERWRASADYQRLNDDLNSLRRNLVHFGNDAELVLAGTLELLGQQLFRHAADACLADGATGADVKHLLSGDLFQQVPLWRLCHSLECVARARNPLPAAPAQGAVVADKAKKTKEPAGVLDGFSSSLWGKVLASDKRFSSAPPKREPVEGTAPKLGLSCKKQLRVLVGEIMCGVVDRVANLVVVSCMSPKASSRFTSQNLLGLVEMLLLDGKRGSVVQSFDCVMRERFPPHRKDPATGKPLDKPAKRNMPMYSRRVAFADEGLNQWLAYCNSKVAQWVAAHPPKVRPVAAVPAAAPVAAAPADKKVKATRGKAK